jgi:hypothetical protein
VDLSGIIFVVLALAWAVYLVPKALKHHDEVARTRSVDRFSTAMRVLARREPVNPRDSRLVVTPPRETARVVLPTRPAPSQQATRRVAAQAAAKRRRTVLLILLGLDVLVAGTAAAGFLPWWSVAVPVALTAAFLVLCRTQVRRQNAADWDLRDAVPSGADASADERSVAPRRAIRVDAAYGTPRSGHNDQGFEEVSPEEDTVTLSASALAAAAAAGSAAEADIAAAHATQLEAVAVSVPTADGGSLWDPLPVTLPTYVTKPRARRTVRTIDLSEPGTWTSGHTEADSRLVEESGAVHDGSAVETEQQRAVGS